MEKKLERNEQNKMIAGVASGLADYLYVDVTIIRIAFILLAVFGFSGVLIYIVMWIAIPEKPFLQNYPNFDTNYKVSEEPFNVYTTPPNPIIIPEKKKSGNGRIIAGIILIFVGGYFLLNELDILPEWFSIFKLWPVVLIAMGLVILFRPGKKKTVYPPQQPFSNESKPTTDGPNTPNDQPLTS